MLHLAFPACLPVPTRNHLSLSPHLQTLRTLGLVHERSLRQGDVKFQPRYILVFDVLVTALGQCCPDLYPKAPIAASLTVDRAHTQELANLISGFYAIIGTTFATSKFRALTTRTSDPIPSSIYDWSWTPMKVPIDGPTETVTHLGIAFTLNNLWKQQGL